MPRPSTFSLRDEDLSLATDLYQLTMAGVYATEKRAARATFELFVRRLPTGRRFLVLAGVEQAVAALKALRFSGEQIDYLRGLAPFADGPETFFDTLADFRFRGNVWAMREGTVFFPVEPVLRVSGTLLETQIVETLLLSIVNFQTMIASKAARVRLAAGTGAASDESDDGDAAPLLAEFGGRRAHGPQAASWVARAAYLAGFDATSNVLAGQRYGIPVVGTMAHSFIMSYDTESEAFRAYLDRYPKHTTLLVDTYDSLEGVRKALRLDRPFGGIRLDSGDLEGLARRARILLDDAGRKDVKIFASGDLDEHRVQGLVAGGAPIDAYGVGTRLAVSSDAPYVGGIYKLVEIEEAGEATPKGKESPGKMTYPGKKQVVRRLDDEGRLFEDRIIPLDEIGRFPLGEHLLRPIMRDGEILESPSLEESRAHCRAELRRLPLALRDLEAGGTDPGEEWEYEAVIDPSLEAVLSERRAQRRAAS